MDTFLYRIFILIYITAARLLSLWNAKARALVKGRKGLLNKIEANLSVAPRQNRIWIHCASMGEFEQGRPIIEKLKSNNPDCIIILTFFSPSGYEVRKNYPLANFVYYLPFDTPGNAKKFVDIVQPSVAIFVKYELWYFFLKNLYARKVPTILIAAIFQPRHVYFKAYGSLHRRMLSFLTHLFVQNEASKKLLAGIGITNVSVAGDTRLDSALAFAQTERAYPLIEAFKGSDKLIIAGSTWIDDENLLHQSLSVLKSHGIKLLLVPHEIHQSHLDKIKEVFNTEELTFYSHSAVRPEHKVMVMDNMGHLAYLYRYADFVWIGGGFTKTGIHNSIEAAVYDKALCWGPRYNRYQEAMDLIAAGAAYSCPDSEQFTAQVLRWLQHPEEHKKAEMAAHRYVNQNKGASIKIIHLLRQQGLL